MPQVANRSVCIVIEDFVFLISNNVCFVGFAFRDVKAYMNAASSVTRLGAEEEAEGANFAIRVVLSEAPSLNPKP